MALSATLLSGDGLTAYINTEEADIVVENSTYSASKEVRCDLTVRATGKGDDINAMTKSLNGAILLVSAIEKSKVDFNPSKTLIGVDISETERATGSSEHGLVHSCARRWASGRQSKGVSTCQ